MVGSASADRNYWNCSQNRMPLEFIEDCISAYTLTQHQVKQDDVNREVHDQLVSCIGVPGGLE